MSLHDTDDSGFDEPTGNQLHATICPECEGTVRTEGGETICQACGLILDEYHIDHGATGWDRLETEDADQRTGAPLTPARHDRGLSTEIGFGGDAHGTPLSGRKRRRISRLRTLHTQARWRSTAERNLAEACGEIHRVGGALDLPDSIREGAAVLYRRAHNNDLIRGRSIEAIATASVYAACRCRGVHRTLAEVADVARVPEAKVELAYRVLSVDLELAVPLAAPQDRLPELAAACETPQRVRRRAVALAERAEQTGIANGRKPSGVAAACLYLASEEAGLGYTQAELADLAGVSVPTLRERYYELQELEK